MSKSVPWRLLSAVVVFALVITGVSARADEPAVSSSATSGSTQLAPQSAPHPPLHVAIASVAPFVLPQTTVPEGFSIDIWNEIARRMHRDFAWYPVATQAELLPAVQHGNADVAIAAITMTPERERVVDFSIPYFDSGLQIMVHTQNDNSFVGSIGAVPWLAIAEFVGVAAAIVFLLANLVWLMERKSDRSFQKPYWRAIGEGLWVTMLIIATGEHGERDAPGVWKRVLVPTMWLIGVVLIAQLTATVTSSQTVARLQSNIRGPDDLPGKTIGTVPGTTAADYLAGRGLPFVSLNNANEGFRLLMQGNVQAIVYDAPTLQYWAPRLGQDNVSVVGPIFRPEKYGIALPGGSQVRKSINEALLAMYDDGTYEQIYRKWFASSK
ncbi:Amino acid ABC transporter substrate-binding protein, PAAT family [Paraburkholderia unamae]|uniref:transporter substrate-binding domain-containing protein n=1 Tax=Paraburkholderia unamae TaxID=219649 RepID=UPI000DC32637|nr:transporter substrate-binding domain-containing protein [Paraburkholderia unamae]RAR67980.1 amino acid ABC transporter substrate-binding protein (PAAT family) [Paraburkholderia unamae]CAG9250055.1 Amino acid ABC transporter substrate-binding protein, PAAT family [Paraburkholderia unamae]